MLRASEAMPSRLGTLDGFFGRIARAFPLEPGSRGIQILPEQAGRNARRHVCGGCLRVAFAWLDDAQREFIEAFKRATFGTEEKDRRAPGWVFRRTP